MSLTLLSNPQKQIIVCVDSISFFTSDVNELDFGIVLPNQQSVTKNITLTNVGSAQGTVLGIDLPTGFFTTQSFPQTVEVGQLLVIPIYFVFTTIATYLDDSFINTNSNTINVSLLAVVQSKGLQFDGVNDYVISTQDFSTEASAIWTMFVKYKDVDWTQNLRNNLFSNISTTLDANGTGIFIGGVANSNVFRVTFRRTIISSDYTIVWSRNILPSSGIIQITYNGITNTLSSLNFYINGSLYTTGKSLTSSNLGSSIITTNQKAQIGRTSSAINGYMTANSKIQEVSFVNYVKSVSELTADYNAGFQSKGTGDWLFRQLFNVGGVPINLKADVLAGSQVDTTIIGQTSGDFVNF